jgi:lipopolysaccharide export system permease protein
MKILDRYLGIAIVTGTLLALLLLVSLGTLMEFVDEMDEIGKQNYTYLTAILFTLLTVPQRIYEFFPAAVLLGSLLSLGNMAANSELVVMRAAGVSVARIIRSALQVGLLLTIGAILLGEFVAPASEQKAHNVRHLAKSSKLALSTRDGLWAKDGNNFLNIQEVFPDMRLGGIRVYQFDENGRLYRFSVASSAEYTGHNWMLTNVRHTFISPERIVTRELAKERWERLLSPDLFDVITVKPQEMSANKLARYVEYLKQNRLDSSRYELAYWTRFTVPLSGLVMLLVAMPFVFGPLRSGGGGQRMFIGILIGVIFHLINQTFNKLGLVYGISPFIAATSPLFIFLTVSLGFIRRVG